jgi:stage V sporulation protein G
MLVTEVKIKIVPDAEKLLAFASVTLDDCFVVRDIKIIQGSKAIFIAMPSRKITDHCFSCGSKNHLQAVYCNQCGIKLAKMPSQYPWEKAKRTKLYADIAHPTNIKCREALQSAIMKGYQEELERSKQPGYVAAHVDDDAGPEFDGPLGTPPQGSPAIIVDENCMDGDGKAKRDNKK